MQQLTPKYTTTHFVSHNKKGAVNLLPSQSVKRKINHIIVQYMSICQCYIWLFYKRIEQKMNHRTNKMLTMISDCCHLLNTVIWSVPINGETWLILAGTKTKYSNICFISSWFDHICTIIFHVLIKPSVCTLLTRVSNPMLLYWSYLFDYCTVLGHV